MAKPILVVRIYWDGNDYGKVERISVNLQNKISDYHVVAIPTIEKIQDDISFEVFNVADINETLHFELKEMILLELRQIYNNGRNAN